MDTYSLDLLFQEPPAGDLTGPAVSEVRVKTCSRNGDDVLLTPQCVTLVELEYQIDRLHKELDAIKTRAQTEYARFSF